MLKMMEEICCDLKLSNESQAQATNAFLKPFILDHDTVTKIKSIFESELEKGLRHGLKGSSLQMENTYVSQLTNGSEDGSYLALDLGGTNFRVMLLEMSKGKIVKEEVEYYSVSESTRLGPGQQLFDFLAQCIADFVSKTLSKESQEKSIPLGFTFSFPMEQQGLNKGILVAWTKSFNASGVVGQDAVKMLNEAIKKLNLNINVVAILNDTTGTLVKGAYDDPKTCIGLILGTGCNGAYLEDTNKVSKWIGAKTSQEVIIDPEFGAFGDNGCIDFIKTAIDQELDQSSLLPKSFTYEKYFAGKYIGELARLILVKLNPSKFKGFEEKDSFTAAMLSNTLQDGANFEQILKLPLNEDEKQIIKQVCHILSERCALLVAIPMAVFIERLDRKDHVGIAVTGSLYKLHPTLKSSLEKYIGKLVKGRKFHTFLSDDGSGKGAGLVAAIAQRI